MGANRIIGYYKMHEYKSLGANRIIEYYRMWESLGATESLVLQNV